VSESNVISNIFKKNTIHNYNYLINKKYNVTVNIYMDKVFGFKKKFLFYFVNVKNLNIYSTNNFNIIRRKKLTSISNKVVRKFV
jgi:hypothetical protein